VAGFWMARFWSAGCQAFFGPPGERSFAGSIIAGDVIADDNVSLVFKF